MNIHGFEIPLPGLAGLSLFHHPHAVHYYPQKEKAAGSGPFLSRSSRLNCLKTTTSFSWQLSFSLLELSSFVPP
jgi:hypothetical protein